MLRTFNYTKRKKIPKEHVKLSVIRIGEKYSFNGSLKTDGLEFPPDAKIFIEAYYQAAYLRFDFGTFSDLKQPEDTDVTDIFRISDTIHFRLKIVNEEKGLILGYADKINLANDENRNKSTIFYVTSIHMETKEIWRLNFDEGDGTPVLELNKSIDGIRELARSDARFLALVYPAAVRNILQRISEENNFDTEGDTWIAKWVRFTQEVLGVYSTPSNNDDEELLKEWYDTVVRSFCVRNKLFEQFTKYF